MIITMTTYGPLTCNDLNLSHQIKKTKNKSMNNSSQFDLNSKRLVGKYMWIWEWWLNSCQHEMNFKNCRELKTNNKYVMTRTNRIVIWLKNKNLTRLDLKLIKLILYATMEEQRTKLEASFRWFFVEGDEDPEDYGDKLILGKY